MAAWSLVALCVVAVVEPAPSGAQPRTVVPPVSDDDDVEIAAKAPIDARLAEVRASLSVLATDISRVEAIKDDATSRRVAAEETLTAVALERVSLAESRIVPAQVRREAALAIYVGGDPSARVWFDSLRLGRVDTTRLSNRVLFKTAEEDAAKQLARLDSRDAELAATERSASAERDKLAERERTATADLAAAVATRTELQTEQADLEERVRRILAIAPRGPLTGLPLVATRPALAVKIDNHPNARPQSGLNQADVVIEELVEGGITRFIAIYHSQDATPVGPVRSGRTSDLMILSNLNTALFGASGGNAGVLAALRQANLVSVIENDFSRGYFRDEGREAPHNLYTRTSSLWGAGRGGGQPPQMFVFRKAGVPSAAGDPTRGVSLRIGNDRVSFSWSGDGWERAVNGSTEEDADGRTLKPTNVIVQFSDYGVSAADAESPEVVATGSGPAWVFTDGKVIQATWTRESIGAVTHYRDGSGADVRLTPGPTWIALPKQGNASLLG